MKPALLSSAQVRERLGVSARALHRLTSSGALPVVRVNARVNRFEPAAVERFIKSRTTTGRAAEAGGAS